MIYKKSKEQVKYDQTHGLNVYPYDLTDHETKAYDYCIKNDIIISPVAAEDGPRPLKWHVGISDPRDYKKVYKSRFQYDNSQIWPEVFKSMVYYYDKYLQKERSGSV